MVQARMGVVNTGQGDTFIYTGRVCSKSDESGELTIIQERMETNAKPKNQRPRNCAVNNN